MGDDDPTADRSPASGTTPGQASGSPDQADHDAAGSAQDPGGSGSHVTPAAPQAGQIGAPQVPAPDYDERGVPSFDHVRDKIESRYATSLGATELAEGTEQGRDLADAEAERKRKAAEKLEEIRRSLG